MPVGTYVVHSTSNKSRTGLDGIQNKDTPLHAHLTWKQILTGVCRNWIKQAPGPEMIVTVVPFNGYASSPSKCLILLQFNLDRDSPRPSARQVWLLGP